MVADIVIIIPIIIIIEKSLDTEELCLVSGQRVTS